MLGSCILVVFWLYLIYYFITSQRPKNFPPGPPPIPIFGNMLHLNIKNPLKDYKRLAKRYGDVYSLYLGKRPAVFLNGLTAIKEALVTKSADFSGRPKDLLVGGTDETKGVALVDYGPHWKEHRRFNLKTLRNLGMGKDSMETRILGEIEHIVEELEKSVGSSMDPQTLFHEAVFNIIHLVAFGNRFDYEDEILKEYIRLYTECAQIATGPLGIIYDAIPVVRHLLLPFKKVFLNYEILNESITNLVNKHKTTRVAGEPRDFVDCYLDEIDKKVKGSSFSETSLFMLLLELYFAGIDTTASTLLTAFLYLVTHSDIQEKCQQEIDEVLQGKAHVSFEDRHNMPYTQAVTHECQRISNIIPLSIFHSTSRDTELMGYSIPKGTLIIPNLSSVLSEEGHWKFAHEFNPLNFLNEKGQFEKPEAFIPFSVGPRKCIGEGLARMELFLILVTLLRHFQFIWPEDAGEPDFNPIYGITLTPKPYRMGVRLRQAAKEI